MSEITYEGLCKKCGFDIRVGYDVPRNDKLICDDHTPSPWSVLTEEEKEWVIENIIRKDIENRKRSSHDIG